MANNYERKVIIIGKTGNGKSSLGNALLRNRKPAFEAKNDFKAVTEHCTLGENEGGLKVVDTPGLFDTDAKGNLAAQALKVQEAIQKCPEPHAFLIVLNGSVRLSEEERSTVSVLKLTFGKELLKHAIIVFTHVENGESDLDFEKRWKGSERMKELVENCGNRVARIDNKNADDKHIKQILKLVDDVSNNGANVFENVYLSLHREVLEREKSIRMYDNKPVREQLEGMLKALTSRQQHLSEAIAGIENKAKESEIRNGYLALAAEFAGKVVGATVIGAVAGASFALAAGQALTVAQEKPEAVIAILRSVRPDLFRRGERTDLNQVLSDLRKSEQSSFVKIQQELTTLKLQSLVLRGDNK